jgi:excisionase family DNA binding protein
VLFASTSHVDGVLHPENRGLRGSDSLGKKLGMMTVKQLAKRLNISADKVYDLVGAGKIEHHKIGCAIRITGAQLAAYLESTRQPVREPAPCVSPRLVRSKHMRGVWVRADLHDRHKSE